MKSILIYLFILDQIDVSKTDRYGYCYLKKITRQLEIVTFSKYIDLNGFYTAWRIDHDKKSGI